MPKVLSKKAAKLELPADTIHLWHCFCDEITDRNLISKYYLLLDEAEKKQQQRFYFSRHRHQYLVTRAFIRSVLSLYDNRIQPQDWRFFKNQYGRPEIEPNLCALSIRFNLSHTDGLIICGITIENDIGVDVENLDRNNDGLKIADRYFSQIEMDELHQQPAQNQRQRFFDYWTLKEAYIKAKGVGLSLPLDQFSFHIPAGAPITISFNPELDDDPKQWQFWRYKASKQHQIAVGVKSSLQNSMVNRRIVPLSHWSDFNATRL